LWITVSGKKGYFCEINGINRQIILFKKRDINMEKVSSKSKDTMSRKVTFIVPAEVAANATSGVVLGEFNNWDDTKGTRLKKQKDGSLKATLTLEAGKTYQYRYLLDDGRWVNDCTADTFAPVSGYGVENCVITVPAAENGQKEDTSEIVVSATAKGDDFTKLEGVGKKIAEILQAAGIISFADLADTNPKKLRSLLDTAGKKFSVYDPTSWPKQAKLAAEGKWPELKKLKAELKGGK
jgi:predicted flap endonuclease-1-like 5' DNA nuclease